MMEHWSFDELTLMNLYTDGTCSGTIRALKEMRGYLDAGEMELLALTDSTISKLEQMTDEAFETLDLFPDFDEEDIDAG